MLFNFISAFIKAIDKMNSIIGQVAAWLTSVLVLLICFDVASRYIFNSTSVAIFELEWHIFALIIMLGAAYALKHDKHVRVDVFYGMMPEKGKAWVNALGGLLFLVPFCLVGIYYGWVFTYNSWVIQECSPDPGGLPYRYLIKSSIPFGLSLLLLQGLSQIGKSVLVIVGRV